MSLHIPKALGATFLATSAGALAVSPHNAVETIKQIGVVAASIIGILNLSRMILGSISNWGSKQVKEAVKYELEHFREALERLPCAHQWRNCEAKNDVTLPPPHRG